MPLSRRVVSILILQLVAGASVANGQSRPRARELGIPIDGTPGLLDAITDVLGVEVGHTTLISGSGKLVVGKGPVRTGVTVVHPRGKANTDPVFGAWFTLNGNGEMTGTTWLQESGILEGPIAITNTHSIGVAHDAILQWQVNRPGQQPWGLPIVAETYDGSLNDINGFHVKTEHVMRALDSAKSGPVQEGNVGGGTGMVCHGFKGGIGTASRVVGEYTIGVLVQCNYGSRQELRIAGVPIGKEITDLRPGASDDDVGSIIVVVATDAPLLPHQLKRIATRVSLGIGRMGGFGNNSSGDIFVAFSTANARFASDTATATVRMMPNARLGPLFNATMQATEVAIVNALLAAETMTGINDFRVHAMPLDRVRAIMAKYGRPLK
ncbi:MAG: P1 family peptidase [Gemmatimonadaceae bacterium]